MDEFRPLILTLPMAFKTGRIVSCSAAMGTSIAMRSSVDARSDPSHASQFSVTYNDWCPIKCGHFTTSRVEICPVTGLRLASAGRLFKGNFTKGGAGIQRARRPLLRLRMKVAELSHRNMPRRAGHSSKIASDSRNEKPGENVMSC